MVNDYFEHLKASELSENTIKSYIKDIKQFETWLDNKELNKDKLIEYKQYIKTKYKTSSVQLKITTINKYLKWLGNENLVLKHDKQQKTNTVDEMTVSEYERMLKYALKLNKIKMYYIMQTLKLTGIRISELGFITVLAVKKGHTTVINKQKERTIIIPKHLSKELKKYCKDNKIEKGIIFHNKLNSGVIDKTYIHREMKKIAGQARIKKTKIHSHSFRHLFAKLFLLEHNNNVVYLADILGHDSLETTRLYTKLSIKELRNVLDK